MSERAELAEIVGKFKSAVDYFELGEMSEFHDALRDVDVDIVKFFSISP